MQYYIVAIEHGQTLGLNIFTSGVFQESLRDWRSHAFNGEVGFYSMSKQQQDLSINSETARSGIGALSSSWRTWVPLTPQWAAKLGSNCDLVYLN